jgi:hypothetical protein
MPRVVIIQFTFVLPKSQHGPVTRIDGAFCDGAVEHGVDDFRKSEDLREWLQWLGFEVERHLFEPFLKVVVEFYHKVMNFTTLLW